MVKSWQKYSVILIAEELLSINLVIFFVIYYFNSNLQRTNVFLLLVSLFLLWFLLKYWRKLQANPTYKSDSIFTNFSKAYIGIISAAVLLYINVPDFVPQINLVVALILGFPALAIPASLLATGLLSGVKDYETEKKHTLIAGVGNLALDVEKELTNREIKGFIKCKKEECRVSQDQIIGEIDKLHDYLHDHPIDELVIALPVKTSKKVRHLVKVADYYGIRVKYVPDYSSVFGKHFRTKRYGHIEAVNIRQLPLDGTFCSLLKSSFDKIFSLGALLFLAPVFAVIAFLIKLDTPGPVFYCPIRIGKGGKSFKVIKFRTMSVNDAPVGGTFSTQVNDPRVTRLGKFLRKYSLDELPQFFNVLIGNMSVVGPRPHRSFLNEQLRESEDKYMIRHYYKPGITGWAQVNGWRGPTETKEQKHQRTIHDIWYMENWSFILDLKIIFLTVFSRKTYQNAF